MNVVIIGAGPAGLTAGYELIKKNVSCTLLEKHPTRVAGISQTVEYKGYRFDLGGHRFFSKSEEINDLWDEMLPRGFMKVKRLSRIYYNKKFYDYPIKPLNTLKNIGIVDAALIFISYFKAKLLPIKPERSFEDWVINRFGRRLFETFFEAYTEKVWGIPCSEISAEWAAQRIKGLSMTSTIRNALLPQKKAGIKTLIDEFKYPKYGPGMLWENVRDVIVERNEVIMDAEVIELRHEDNRIMEVITKNNSGKKTTYQGDQFISTMPLRDLILSMSPKPPQHVTEAAQKLKYRSFLTVALIIDKEDIFPDNWVYMHDPAVKLGRLQNPKNWSGYMVPDPKKSCLGLEYFCSEGDSLWTTQDAKLVDIGKTEVDILGIVKKELVEDGCVIRMPKAYPVYDDEYIQTLEVIRNYLKEFKNLQVCGRYGMHRYNNMDHSMMTAILATKNLFGGNYDVWGVNVDAEYQEGIK